MVGFRLAPAAVAAISLFASSVIADVDPIVIKGSKFFYKTNGTEFFIRGVAYQQDVGGPGAPSTNAQFIDPLTDAAGCARDIPYLTSLRTNTIRVYAIDTTQDHTACMTALANAGIYLVADLSAPNISINRNDPSWNTDLYARYTSVIDLLSQYNNVIGFFAGNEVANNATSADALPFVKAAVRDMKAYISSKNYRPMGVGYAADDGSEIRTPVRNYLNCGPASDSIDFYGYNIYSWCNPSSYQQSGYAARTAEFQNYSVPAFFAEYGCNVPEPRTWNETLALFSAPMDEVWSGGIVYEYFQASNSYGLVEVNNGAVTTLGDYGRLETQIARVSPSGVQAASYTPTNTVAQACPATSTFAAATNLPPTPNDQLCSCMVESLSCVAKSSVSTSSFGDLFNIACNPQNGAGICDGIANDGATGSFGAYSMCSPSQQLSWAFNAYFQEQAAQNSANTDACDFGGNATTQAVGTPTGSCASLVSQAGGSAGTGTVTSAPTNSGASTSKSAAGTVVVPAFDFTVLSMGLYVVMAAFAGMGIILL